MAERLKTFQLDTAKGQCLVNGEDISQTCHYLKLEFSNGEWSLTISEKKSFESSATRKVTKEETSI